MAGHKARLRGVSGESAGPVTGQVIRLSSTRRIKARPAALKRRGVLLRAEAGAEQVFAAHSALKSRLLKLVDQHAVRSLMITSPVRGAGKTVTAINLAVQIARHTDRTALLLDLNFHRPAVHRFFGRRAEKGIVDCLRGDVRLADILFSPLERLSIAPCGGRAGRSEGLCDSPRLVDLLQETVSRYRERLVILDMPSALECDDVIALSPHTGANLVVLEAGKTTQREVEQTLECLSGTRTLGMVLNRVKSSY